MARQGRQQHRIGTGRRKTRSRTPWRRCLIAFSSAHVSFRRVALSRLCGSLVWFAAWALIFQSALAFCSMSAAVAGPGTPAALICQHSADESSPDDISPAAKQCASCPFCALGRGVTLPQATVIALPMPIIVAILAARIEVVPPLSPSHERPVARGPPTTV